MITDFRFSPADLTAPRPAHRRTEYVIDPALHNAVRVAILLQQPLLLTGEPGTGKTRLAEKLAADLSQLSDSDFLDRPLIFHTKTTSTFTDLFYSYDALGHFHAAHFNDESQFLNKNNANATPQAASFVQLQALGQAILLSNAEALADYNRRGHTYLPMNGVPIDRPRSSVVLIDEVDKAPRDFANDLLNELDRFEFCVREDRNRTYCKGEGRVMAILTSNSEKNLPDAFLRRCVFFHIEFPDEKQLLNIVLGQLFTDFADYQENKAQINSRLSEYVRVFMDIRDKSPKKPPATAELISWIYFLRQQVLDNIPYNQIDKAVRQSGNSILAKHKDDLLALNAALTN